MEYETVLKVVFGLKIPETFSLVPLFSEHNKIELILTYHYLNAKKKNVLFHLPQFLKQILWVLRETIKELQYSPMLIHIICFFLIFLNEAETYSIINFLIRRSSRIIDEGVGKTNLRHLKWHFSLDPICFSKLCKSFFGFVTSKDITFKELYIHFKRLKLNYIELFENWCANFFQGFLPLPVVLEII